MYYYVIGVDVLLLVSLVVYINIFVYKEFGFLVIIKMFEGIYWYVYIYDCVFSMLVDNFFFLVVIMFFFELICVCMFFFLV